MIYEQTIVSPRPFDEVLAGVKAALADQGFGTLTEIDLQATLEEKIGKTIDRYVIVGACNPNLAGRALDAEPRIGVLLPCNVVVRQDGSDVVVEAADPHLMASVTGDDAMEPIAAEASERIGKALGQLG